METNTRSNGGLDSARWHPLRRRVCERRRTMTFTGEITNIDGRCGWVRDDAGTDFWFHAQLARSPGVLFDNLREGHIVLVEEVDRSPRGERRCRILKVTN